MIYLYTLKSRSGTCMEDICVSKISKKAISRLPIINTWDTCIMNNLYPVL